jgi:hypothetical protein
MPSRRLTKDEAAQADALLAEVKRMVTNAADGDPVLLFALRRRLFTRLMYWERSTPAERTKLKAAKWKAQRGLCTMCDEPMDVKGSELDRADPVDGYTAENTRLVHHACHRADQATKGFR